MGVITSPLRVSDTLAFSPPGITSEIAGPRQRVVVRGSQQEYESDVSTPSSSPSPKRRKRGSSSKLKTTCVIRVVKEKNILWGKFKKSRDLLWAECFRGTTPCNEELDLYDLIAFRRKDVESIYRKLSGLSKKYKKRENKNISDSLGKQASRIRSDFYRFQQLTKVRDLTLDRDKSKTCKNLHIKIKQRRIACNKIVNYYTALLKGKKPSPIEAEGRAEGRREAPRRVGPSWSAWHTTWTLFCREGVTCPAPEGGEQNIPRNTSISAFKSTTLKEQTPRYQEE
jgi:hypothetical protein